MTKKQIINQINLAAAMGAASLRFMLRHRQHSLLLGLEDIARAEATAYNQCAGNLAREIGIASYIWDKPIELKQAA